MNWKATCCIWAGIFSMGPVSERISLEETVEGTSLLTSGCRTEIRCSPNAEGIWNVTDWSSILFC
jgi:hypothetical protein